jgi:hypothetical protein
MLKLTLLSTLPALVSTTPNFLCGLTFAPCDLPETCVPFYPTCTDFSRCIGLCTAPVIEPVIDPTSYRSCGGFTAIPQRCPVNYTCQTDPRLEWFYLDMPGICVPNDVPTCGGFAGGSCQEDTGLECYDDPRDSCDPKRGGADCIGVCLYPLKSNV